MLQVQAKTTTNNFIQVYASSEEDLEQFYSARQIKSQDNDYINKGV